jgi:hypothetical protein
MAESSSCSTDRRPSARQGSDSRQVLGQRRGEVAGGLGPDLHREAAVIEGEVGVDLDRAVADPMALASLDAPRVAFVLDR